MSAATLDQSAKWQPAAIAATVCSKVAAVAVGYHFISKWSPALSASASGADLSQFVFTFTVQTVKQLKPERKVCGEFLLRVGLF